MESKPSLKFIQLGIYFLVPTYTNCIVTCSLGWLNWDLTSHQQLRSYGYDKISSIGIKRLIIFLGKLKVQVFFWVCLIGLLFFLGGQ